MPVYDYKCPACGHTFSALMASGNSPADEVLCPGCGCQEPEKLLSRRVAVVSGRPYETAPVSRQNGCGCGSACACAQCLQLHVRPLPYSPFSEARVNGSLNRILLAGLLPLTVDSAQAFWQWNGRTHPELTQQVITCRLFNTYYHRGLEEVACQGAAIADQVYQPIMDQLELGDFGRTDMVFTAQDEIMNGFAFPSNQILIWVRQDRATGWFLGSEKWLRLVIVHEFQHVALINGLKTWPGIWNLLLVPGWFVEGSAEHYTEKWRV